MNESGNKLRVQINGAKKEATVLDIFSIDKYPDKEYIIYYLDDTAKDNVLVSVLEQSDTDVVFKDIKNENEWKDVQVEVVNKEKQLKEMNDRLDVIGGE